MKTYAQLTLPFIEDQSTFSRAGFPANHTQLPESDSARRTLDISGRRCFEQYERYGHAGSWARMFSALLIGMEDWYSRRCALTCELKGTKYNRMYFQLQASTPRTNEIGSGLLLTPGLVEIAETPEKYQERQRKRTNNGLNKAPHPGNKFNCLTSQVLYSGMLPTPLANDIHHEKRVEALKAMGAKTMASRKNGANRPTGLRDYLHFNGLLPTPKATEIEEEYTEWKQRMIASGNPKNIGKTTANLGTMARSGLLPTPQAMDVRTDVRKPEERSQSAKKGGCSNLREWAGNGMLPTPCATESEKAGKGTIRTV